nr:hydroxyacid-oxoacid transhydrogenase, mitochondrial-like isoform X2 [Procambarus clarkii]
MAGRVKVFQLLKSLSSALCQCPAHSAGRINVLHSTQSRKTTDYAFEMACSTVRYGPGVTKEVGQDLQTMGAKKVLVMTDKTLATMSPVSTVLDSLAKHRVNFSLYDNVRIEPTDSSFKNAVEFAKSGCFDAYVAVGGGSVIDTCKAANLYASDPHADFLDYVNPPIGKGKPVTVQLSPLIAIPTTAGTGSETTGVAIFDYEPMKAKTGIASRALRPTLGIIDPLHTLLMPERVAAYSGSVYHQDDVEARSKMHLASTCAGVGFGNAGVHLCHGMSYPISGNVKNFHPEGYKCDHAIIPHGLSVVMTSPAVFAFTAPMCPERHLEAVQLLGKDITGIKREDAGLALADVLRSYMSEMKVDNGLEALGFTEEDIPALVKGTLPQHRVTKLAPREQSEDDLAYLFERSMKIY